MFCFVLRIWREKWWSQQKPKDICWNLTKCVFCPSKVAILTATDNLLWSPCPRLRFWWAINLAKVGILYFYCSKNNTHTYLDPFSTNGDYALCSRDFQNVLIWSFHDFTATQTYVKSNFGELKRSKIVIFGNFRDSELRNLVDLGLECCSNLKNQNSEPLKLPKRHFLTIRVCSNLILRKIWVSGGKITTKWSLNFTFERFWSIV